MAVHTSPPVREKCRHRYSVAVINPLVFCCEGLLEALDAGEGARKRVVLRRAESVAIKCQYLRCRLTHVDSFLKKYYHL
jgi:hypothetical protein